MVDGGEDARHVHGRDSRLDLVEFGLHRLGHAHVRGALGFEDAEGGRRAAVEPRDGAHLRDAVVHVGDFAQAHRIAAGHDDLRVRQRLRRLGAAQHADRLLAAAHLGPAAGGIHVERAQLLVDFRPP